MQPACRFALPSKVFSVAMSSVASAHCLLAVSQQEEAVKLCDPASGAFTHTLAGHR
jgi:DNA excision repair protein ERCC-8